MREARLALAVADLLVRRPRTARSVPQRADERDGHAVARRATRRTSGPTASITPASSWPGTWGSADVGVVAHPAVPVASGRGRSPRPGPRRRARAAWGPGRSRQPAPARTPRRPPPACGPRVDLLPPALLAAPVYGGTGTIQQAVTAREAGDRSLQLSSRGSYLQCTGVASPYSSARSPSPPWRPPPRPRRPHGRPPRVPPIHPGVQTFTDGGQCTANFVFYDGSTRLHRPGRALLRHRRQHRDQRLHAGSLPTGTPVDVTGAGKPGTMVYNSWLTMQAAGETDPDTCQYNDLALDQARPGRRGKVNPSIPFWGGPTGVGGDDRARRQGLLVRQLRAARRRHPAEPEGAATASATTRTAGPTPSTP